MKKSKSFIFLLLGILIIGIALFGIAGTLAGWDILGWFASPTAILIYLIIGILGITMILIWWKGKN